MLAFFLPIIEEWVELCYNRQDYKEKRDKCKGTEGDFSMSITVTLISHTPMPEQTIASAAKLCYSPAKIETIMDGLDQEKSASFVDMLAEIGHESPIEHASFTFGIEGVSRAFLAQITRHRIASYSVQSQRYVTAAQFEYVVPPEIEQEPLAKAEFLRAMEEDQKSYDKITAILKEKHVKALLKQGEEEKSAARKAEKQAIEDARFVLPNACCTKMICTFNARSLMNFFSLRCCNRAQWEIREVAMQMLSLCKQAAPGVFKKAGPPCVRGGCPEGKMTCGKIKEVRAYFARTGEKSK